MRNSTSPFLQSHSSARHSRGEMAKGASRSSPSSRKKRRTKPGLGKGRRTKSKTSLPPAVRKHADILCLLSRSSPAQAWRILNRGLGDAGLVRALAECSHNVLSGALSLTPNQHRRLKRHKTALRRLTADHRGLSKRRGSRRALTRHRAFLMRGGFLGSLLGVVAPLIAGALGKVIGSEWREQQQHTYIQPRTWERRPRLQARAWRKWFWCDHPSFLDCQQQQQEVNSVGVGCPPPPSQPVAVASGSRRESNRSRRKSPGWPLPEAPHGFPPQVGNRRAESKVTKKRRRKRTAHRPEDYDDEDGDDLHLVAMASPSQVAKLRRLRRLRRQLKVTKKRGPTWSRRDMLAYNAKLRNALEQQDLGPTVQGAAKAPVAVKGVLEPAWDSEDGDSEEDDGDEDEEAVSDVMAVREHVVPASVAVRARALLRLIRKTEADRRQLTWAKHTHELVLKGRPIAGTDIFDLVVHVTRDHHSKRPKAWSPRPPPGFDRFAGCGCRARGNEEQTPLASTVSTAWPGRGRHWRHI